jgi:hypothetical protein
MSRAQRILAVIVGLITGVLLRESCGAMVHAARAGGRAIPELWPLAAARRQLRPSPRDRVPGAAAGRGRAKRPSPRRGCDRRRPGGRTMTAAPPADRAAASRRISVARSVRSWPRSCVLHAPNRSTSRTTRNVDGSSQPGDGRQERSAGGRNHKDALVGSMVWSTTATSSAQRVSRSTSSRSRALNASIVLAAL